jgi:sec-independent protein translocase protein TatA
MLAFLEGPDLIILLIVIAVLFGGSRLPKLARSLGSAKSEFEKGLREGASQSSDDEKPKDEPAK